MRAHKLVVIGVGQSMRGDDAAGLLAVETWMDTSPSLRNDPGISVELAELPGLSLLDLLSKSQSAILVDAVHGGGIPGTIHLLQAHDLLAFEADTHSAHGWGVAETLKLGWQLDPQHMPHKLVIIGVEGENFDIGSPLSPAVQGAIPGAAALIERQVELLH